MKGLLDGEKIESMVSMRDNVIAVLTNLNNLYKICELSNGKFFVHKIELNTMVLEEDKEGNK